MIFVTVGTSHYDPLIQKMDELVAKRIISDTVIAQIGRGMYVPKNFRSFRFIRSLSSAYEKADIIVSTGGAGTTMECVTRGLKLVVIENTSLMEGHQAQLIQEMSSRGHLIWCKNIDDLAASIDEAKSRVFEKFVTDENLAAKKIIELIESK